MTYGEDAQLFEGITYSKLEIAHHDSGGITFTSSLNSEVLQFVGGIKS